MRNTENTGDRQRMHARITAKLQINSTSHIYKKENDVVYISDTFFNVWNAEAVRTMQILFIIGWVSSRVRQNVQSV